MSAAWPTARLGEVLTPILREHTVDASREYPLLGIRLDGHGPFHRETVLGTQTSASRLYEVRAGDFIYSRLFAWRGAFGLIEPELDGHFVSNEFPTFTAINGRVEPKFLRYWFRLPDVLRRVEADCSGSTPLTRNRYKEQYFFALEIPLPPLDEQRRIVARIEELAAKVEEARRLSDEAEQHAQSLLRSIIQHDMDRRTIRVGEVVSLRTPDIVVQPDQEYQFAGVYSFGRGVFRSVRKMGSEFSYPRLTRLRTGNFVYPKLMAWEGALGVVPPQCDGMVVSTEFPVFDIKQEAMVPEVLDVYFRSPEVWPGLSGQSGGTNVRRRRLNPQDFLDLQVPLPTMLAQQKLVNTARRLQDIQKLRTETAAELHAMLPAILDKAFKGEL